MLIIVFVGGQFLTPIVEILALEFQLIKLLHHKFIRGEILFGAATLWALEILQLADAVLTVKVRAVSARAFNWIQHYTSAYRA